MRKTILLLAALAVLAAPATAAAKPTSRQVDLQILAVNDFHGNLEPPTGTLFGTTAGGAQYLATHLRELREGNKYSLTVSAGDLIGASPLLSALFHDEPTIEAMNLMGLDYNAVGNHEFDEGAAELLRMQRGGCHPTDGCLDGDGFGGAEFGFLAANVVDATTGETIFPAYEIRKVGGVRVAIIGMTLEGTPDIVSPSGVAGLEFRDEAETVRALMPELERRHVEAIVVLLHEGLVQSGTGIGLNTCKGASGPLVDIVSRMPDEVDVVVSGHTHAAYNCVLDGVRVTSAASSGRVVTELVVTLDRKTKDVVRADAENLFVTRNVPLAADIGELIAKYSALAAPLRDRVIGRVAGDLSRTPNAAGESVLGDVIADAQLAATSSAQTGNAVAAFMNPGGIRADLLGGDVTYGEAFTVQPFGNSLVTMTLTGAQLDTLLESQWPGCNGQTSTRILQVSHTVSYTWDAAAPVCNRVSQITIGGAAVDPAASYRITVNSFLADGGDGFAVLRSGTSRLGGAVDTDALEDYLAPTLSGSPLPVPQLGRIKRIN